jgi:photosystem II stability/assembly factor-like uncharacterized protein
MKRWLTVLAVLGACSLAFLPGGHAQQGTGKETGIFSHMHFVDLGPANAGGRVSAVVGIPGNPNVYYVGGAGGGVWKTMDGGLHWKAIFQHEDSGSIGAIALAPSNPNLVWVGTGEANPRNDMINGAGLYFSPDGGHTWKFMGFRHAGQISTILIDPHDSNTVFVGVLGNVWKPTTDRGVFKTTDGGKTWKKVLYVNDTTGVSNMVMGPDNPRVLFAGMWQVRRYPWELDDGGPGSGIYRSTDGGATWTKLSKGLPKGPLGRIALAVAPTNPDHVYAIVEAKHGLLWQSLNMGNSWKPVSDNYALDVRPFYFSRIFVAPNNQEKIYTLSLFLMESDNGGRTAHILDRGVHVDHHALWIDPKDPNRIIQGNDGGAYLTLNGGKTWKFLDGMPIEEDYMVAVGPGHPYLLCAGLQDNNAWCGNEQNGWYVVAGGDGQYAVPAPSDPNVIYADSQNGYISRLNVKTRERWSVKPYLPGVSQETPSELKYRFNWTAPIAVSPVNKNVVYLGANVLFASNDGGRTWTVDSPDLTRNDKADQVTSGGPIEYDISGAETYDTITAITIAPSNPNVIWVGSDDGLVHVTENGGKTWTNVTANIPGAPAWASVYQVGVSPFNPGSAYVSFDGHKMGNDHAYVYRTHDYGKTWQEITNGLPSDEPVDVVREDPNQRGLLILGSWTGLYYSTNDGDQWQKFPVSFPVTPVFDVQFAKFQHALVVATHGRGIFVLNDIRPIEEMTPTIEASNFHLFKVNDATLQSFFYGGMRGEQSNLYHPRMIMPGARIDYFLKTAIKGPEHHGDPGMMGPHHGPVKIVITNAAGQVVATHYAPGKAGVNRYIWNLRYEAPVPYRWGYKPPRAFAFFFRGGGPEVAPGTYKVAVTADGQTQTQTVTVVKDPSIPTVPGAFRQEVAYGLEGRSMMTALDETLNHIHEINQQIFSFASDVRPNDHDAPNPRYQKLLAEGRSIHQALHKIEEVLYNTKIQRNAPEDSLHWLADLHGKVQGLQGTGSIGYGQPVTAQARAQMALVRGELQTQLTDYNQVVKTEVASYNRLAKQANAPQLFAGAPVVIQPAGGK